MSEYQRADLEKLLVQDFGCTWRGARNAVSMYLHDGATQAIWVGASSSPPFRQPHWALEYEGDPIAITEWIWGTKIYWVNPRTGKPWKYPR